MDSDFLNENNDDNIEQAQSADENSADSSSEIISQEEKPRKRKIVKNNPLPIIFVIFLILFLFTFGWKAFFDQSILGTWNYIDTYSVTETYDSASTEFDTADSASVEYSSRVVYEFNEDGQFNATIGTVTVTGEYSLNVDSSGNNVVSFYALYDNTPLIYGSYTYKVKGSIFTGKKLLMTSSFDGSVIELTPGEGENPLVPFEDFTPDENLYGKWRNDEMGITYTFDEDGYMVFTTDNGIIFEHVYTTYDDYIILAKYYSSQSEESYSYIYTLSDGVLNIDGLDFTKVE